MEYPSYQGFKKFICHKNSVFKDDVLCKVFFHAKHVNSQAGKQIHSLKDVWQYAVKHHVLYQKSFLSGRRKGVFFI